MHHETRGQDVNVPMLQSAQTTDGDFNLIYCVPLLRILAISPAFLPGFSCLGGLRDSSRLSGSRSNMEESETLKTLQMSKRRAALTRLRPLSYFGICWKLTPNALPSSCWLMLRAIRRSRTRAPMYASTGVAFLGASLFTFAFFISAHF